jgi:hypothetical protein
MSSECLTPAVRSHDENTNLLRRAFNPAHKHCQQTVANQNEAAFPEPFDEIDLGTLQRQRQPLLHGRRARYQRPTV